MKNNRLNRLLNSPLFKESSGHEEDEELEKDEVGAEETNEALDSEELIGEDLSYLDDLDDEDE